MSIRYAVAVVLILKWTVCPWSTLMSVANPSMDGDGSRGVSHWSCGLPGLEFSHAIGLATPGSQIAADAEAGHSKEASQGIVHATTKMQPRRKTRFRGWGERVS